MNKFILLTISSVFLINFNSSAQYNQENLKIKRSSEFSEPSTESAEFEQYDMSYEYENLRLYPIIANNQFEEEHKDIGKFTLLKDAIEDDKIVITETGATHLADDASEEHPDDSIVEIVVDPSSQFINNQVEYNQGSFGQGVDGTVNTLFAQNNSQDTIFIMAGEVVKGGKQDRVIGQDVVIAPGENVNLSAFCVERNRWTTKDGNDGKFTGYYNVANMDIRKTAATDDNQSEVWRKVGEQTATNGASSTTGTYTNLENSAEYQENLAKYMETFKTAFKNDPNVIGVIAVTGDKVMGCDMFATHDLFISSYESLLHSYIGEAMTNGSKVTLDNEEAFNYLSQILKDESTQEETINENGVLYKWKNKKIHVSTF
ncbi:MAG: hypothetical protein P8P74_08885 [Crocinitomicaceae bacterium]|nr:hypothetical protein [Crocinitomicaceae bacterium]